MPDPQLCAEPTSLSTPDVRPKFERRLLRDCINSLLVRNSKGCAYLMPFSSYEFLFYYHIESLASRLPICSADRISHVDMDSFIEVLGFPGLIHYHHGRRILHDILQAQGLNSNSHRIWNCTF